MPTFFLFPQKQLSILDLSILNEIIFRQFIFFADHSLFIFLFIWTLGFNLASIKALFLDEFLKHFVDFLVVKHFFDLDLNFPIVAHVWSISDLSNLIIGFLLRGV